jgi:hypothetical protein
MGPLVDDCAVAAISDPSESELDELVAHLWRTTPLGPQEAARVVAEVVAFFSETAEAFVRRRHRELHSGGLTNPAIFGRVSRELLERRVAAPPLTDRQLRRIVYG